MISICFASAELSSVFASWSSVREELNPMMASALDTSILARAAAQWLV